MRTKFIAILSFVSAVAAFSFQGCAGTSTRESTGEYIDDSAITTKVKYEFARDPVVSAIAVDVKTFKGTVELSGFVDTREQKSRAGDIAKGVNGVRKVENKISVK